MRTVAFAAALLIAGGATGQSVTAGAATAGEAVMLTGAFTQGGLLHGRVARGSVVTVDGKAVAVADDGSFILGVAPDSAAVLTLNVARGGRTSLRTIAIAQRSWPVERLPGLPRFAQPSAEFARRRPAELAQIATARVRESDVQGWRQAFVQPAQGRFSGQFGARRIYANSEEGAPHAGLDIAAPSGAPVVAPADGVVVLATAAPFTLEGNLLIVDHGMGLNSAFLHLSEIAVRVGERVRQGQAIGRVGATGRATGPHLHWALTWRAVRLDPRLALP